MGFYSSKNVFRGQAIMGEGLRGVIGDYWGIIYYIIVKYHCNNFNNLDYVILLFFMSNKSMSRSSFSRFTILQGGCMKLQRFPYEQCPSYKKL